MKSKEPCTRVHGSLRILESSHRMVNEYAVIAHHHAGAVLCTPLLPEPNLTASPEFRRVERSASLDLLNLFG